MHNRLNRFQQVKMIEKNSETFSENPSQTQESNKINGVQFRLRMTKNQYKQSKVPKLLFRKTQPNEPAGLVYQSVHIIEKRFQKILEPSLKSQESKKINGVQFRLRMTKNQHKRANYPNCHSSKLNSMNRLIWFLNQFKRLREALKICQTIPQKVINQKKQTK